MDKEVMVSVPMDRYTKLIETETKFMLLQQVITDLHKAINENRKTGPSTEIIIQRVTTDES